MAAKYRDGILRCNESLELFGDKWNRNELMPSAPAGIPHSENLRVVFDQIAATKVISGLVGRKWDCFSINEALTGTWDLVQNCNAVVDRTAPWKLANDDSQADLLDAVLYILSESLRVIAILISPVLPKAAHGIFDQLNWKMELSGQESRFALKHADWGGLPNGHVVGKPVPLFPRIETE